MIHDGNYAALLLDIVPSSCARLSWASDEHLEKIKTEVCGLSLSYKAKQKNALGKSV